MNKERRKKIEAVCQQITEMTNKLSEWRDDSSAMKEELETLRDEEQEYLDAMPESLKSGEKADASETIINEMNELLEKVEAIADALEDLPDPEGVLNNL